MSDIDRIVDLGRGLLELLDRLRQAEAENCTPLKADHPALVDADKSGYARGWQDAISENRNVTDWLDGQLTEVARERDKWKDQATRASESLAGSGTCRVNHPTNETVVPCVLPLNHAGEHKSTTGCPGSVMTWPTAEMERDKWELQAAGWADEANALRVELAELRVAVAVAADELGRQSAPGNCEPTECGAYIDAAQRVRALLSGKDAER